MVALQQDSQIIMSLKMFSSVKTFWKGRNRYELSPFIQKMNAIDTNEIIWKYV